MSSPSRTFISRDEIRAVYAQGEDAVIDLVESLLARINSLEERLEAQMFCRIRGYLSTRRKQGHNIWDALVQLFMGVPISPIPKAE